MYTDKHAQHNQAANTTVSLGAVGGHIIGHTIYRIGGTTFLKMSFVIFLIIRTRLSFCNLVGICVLHTFQNQTSDPLCEEMLS